jgi:hypothetical protein
MLCAASPPRLQCPFSPSLPSCRAEVQTFLDRWYADFNVVFTYQRPAAGNYDTIIVTGDGAWCFVDPSAISFSPEPTCSDVGGGPVVLFKCDSAKACASLVAKEQAHNVGLSHTLSPTDVMNGAATAHDGFEDRDNAVSDGKCRVRQNSYRLMLERLGPWPGGPKPSPEGTTAVGDASVDTGSTPDAGEPSGMDAHPTEDGADDGRPVPQVHSGCAVVGVRDRGLADAGVWLLLVVWLMIRARGADGQWQRTRSRRLGAEPRPTVWPLR